MRDLLPILLISAAALLGCQSPPPAPAKPVAATPTGKRVETIDSCVDGWLARHHLDSFGNPPNTEYTGGNPLLDERSMKQLNRFDYLFQHHPDLAKACRPAGK